MYIIDTNYPKTLEALYDDYAIYDELKSTKPAFEVLNEEQNISYIYGGGPIAEEAEQILETKYGKPWDELVKLIQNVRIPQRKFAR